MELPDESVSLVVIFALFFFFIWDESVTSVLAKIVGKAFIHVTKKTI